jgi:hypothetical protein
VVGRAPPVLSRARLAAFAVLGAIAVTWYVVAPHLANIDVWWDIAIACLFVIPGTLGLVALLSPLREWRWTLALAVVVGIAAILFEVADWGLPANFAKLLCFGMLGVWFLRWFEALWWVVLVAAIIPVVDAISVWRGPTHSITSHHFEVYTTVSIAFVVPHGSAAYLGPPDVLFYGLFLAAAHRFRLRTVWTWIGTTLAYGVTVVVAQAAHVGGLPALPFLSVAFLLANADLLWRRRRAKPLH